MLDHFLRVRLRSATRVVSCLVLFSLFLSLSALSSGISVSLQRQVLTSSVGSFSLISFCSRPDFLSLSEPAGLLQNTGFLSLSLAAQHPPHVRLIERPLPGIVEKATEFLLFLCDLIPAVCFVFSCLRITKGTTSTGNICARTVVSCRKPRYLFVPIFPPGWIFF